VDLLTLSTQVLNRNEKCVAIRSPPFRDEPQTLPGRQNGGGLEIPAPTIGDGDGEGVHSAEELAG